MLCISMQRIKINLITQTKSFKNVYLTKNILIYVIYTDLNVSVQTQILHVETIILANFAENKLYLP